MITGQAASQWKAREIGGNHSKPTLLAQYCVVRSLTCRSISTDFQSPFLSRVARYLEPLAIAANIVQQSFCQLNQVLITFGYLTMKYNTDQMKQDTIGCQAILDSIEARWAKSDQEVFVAMVLNPFFQMSVFWPLQCFNKAEMRVLFTKLYRRFFAVEPPHTFIEDTYNFLDGKK